MKEDPSLDRRLWSVVSGQRGSGPKFQVPSTFASAYARRGASTFAKASTSGQRATVDKSVDGSADKQASTFAEATVDEPVNRRSKFQVPRRSGFLSPRSKGEGSGALALLLSPACPT